MFLTPTFYVEGLTPNVTVFGDGAFTKVGKVKQGEEGEALIQQNWHPHRREMDTRARPLSGRSHREKATAEHSGKLPSASRGQRPHQKPTLPAT